MDILQKLKSPATVFYNYEADEGTLFKEASEEITTLRQQLKTSQERLAALPAILREYDLHFSKYGFTFFPIGISGVPIVTSFYKDLGELIDAARKGMEK